MIKANIKVLVDLGNSETRAYIIVNGKAKEIKLSNRFAVMEENAKVQPEYNNTNSTVFMFDNDYIANGEIVDMEYISSCMRPVAFERKTNQVVSMYSLNLILIKAVNMVSGQLGVKPIDIEWHFNVSVLIPPTEHDMMKEKMEKQVRRISSLTSCTPISYKNLPIILDGVKVMPESLVAFTSAMFKENTEGKLEIVAENKKFQKGYIFIMDIGAGTTDVAMVKNSKFMLSTKQSFDKGGNRVENDCKRLIYSEYGFSPSDMTSVITRGILEDGNDMHDVSKLLDKAKDMYAKNIMNDIRGYLENLAIPVREIRGLLLVGGGTMPTMRDDIEVSKPMSAPILELFKDLSPSIELVNLNGVSPREANIEGLRLMTLFG